MQALQLLPAPSYPPSVSLGQGVGSLAFASPRQSASAVPESATLATAVTASGQPARLRAYEPGVVATRILHPSQAPSAITSENALWARALNLPVYVHDSAASRMARLSNILRDAPRFGQAVNILA